MRFVRALVKKMSVVTIAVLLIGAAASYAATDGRSWKTAREKAVVYLKNVGLRLKTRVKEKAVKKLKDTPKDIVVDKIVSFLMYEGNKHIGGPFTEGGGDEDSARALLSDAIDPTSWGDLAVVILNPFHGSHTATPDEDSADAGRKVYARLHPKLPVVSTHPNQVPRLASPSTQSSPNGSTAINSEIHPADSFAIGQQSSSSSNLKSFLDDFDNFDPPSPDSNVSATTVSTMNHAQTPAPPISSHPNRVSDRIGDIQHPDNVPSSKGSPGSESDKTDANPGSTPMLRAGETTVQQMNEAPVEIRNEFHSSTPAPTTTPPAPVRSPQQHGPERQGPIFEHSEPQRITGPDAHPGDSPDSKPA
jgi:hypothetical protein